MLAHDEPPTIIHLSVEIVIRRRGDRRRAHGMSSSEVAHCVRTSRCGTASAWGTASHRSTVRVANGSASTWCVGLSSASTWSRSAYSSTASATAGISGGFGPGGGCRGSSTTSTWHVLRSRHQVRRRSHLPDFHGDGCATREDDIPLRLVTSGPTSAHPARQRSGASDTETHPTSTILDWCRSPVRFFTCRVRDPEMRCSGSKPTPKVKVRATLSGRLQLAEQRRNQLRDGRVDRHGPLQRRIGHAGVHHVEDAVDRLVAAGAEDRGAEDLAASRRRRRSS